MFNFSCSYILTNLTPSTQYGVYVIAVRLIGKSEILEGSRSITATAKTLSTNTVQGKCTHNSIWTVVCTHFSDIVYIYIRYSGKVTKLFNYSAVNKHSLSLAKIHFYGNVAILW